MWTILSRSPLAASLLGIALSVLLVACGESTEPPPAVSVATQTLPAPTADTGSAPAVTSVPAAVPTATPAEAATSPSGPPQSGRWIDVNVSSFTVRLMDGASAMNVIGPIGVGVQINTGVYESTQTGLFHVYSMDASLTYDAPYDTYISHWIGFDPAKDNGFHSFLKDATGKVVDPSTGRVSNGCIRTGAAEAIFAFAEIGMPVYVHL